MKTIMLVRHAKSSWENFTVKDIDRPLNDRGKKNAPEMAGRLLEKKVAIDAFLSSPAKRAKATADFFAKAYSVDIDQIITVPELYMANGESFINAIRNAPDTADSIALFSHNTGITEFANSLSEATIDHMPTCAIFAVRADIAEWKSFEPGACNFYFFDYPKKALS